MELNTKRTKEDDNDQAKSESRGGIRRRIRKFVVFRLTKRPNDDNRYKSFLVIVAFLSFISLARTRSGIKKEI